MNMLAAIRNAPIRYNVSVPVSMNDYWRNYHVAVDDCNCNMCTGNFNSYGDTSHDAFASSPRKDLDEDFTELIELAWKEREEEIAKEIVDQTEKIWKKRERSRRKAPKMEASPEVASTHARPTEWEVNSARKAAHAARRRNTERRQKRRLELIRGRVIGTETVAQKLKKNHDIVGLREITRMTPHGLKKGYGYTGAFKIVLTTPHKLKRKPWQAAHTPVKVFDYTERVRRARSELRSQSVAARSTWA